MLFPISWRLWRWMLEIVGLKKEWDFPKDWMWEEKRKEKGKTLNPVQKEGHLWGPGGYWDEVWGVDCWKIPNGLGVGVEGGGKERKTCHLCQRKLMFSLWSLNKPWKFSRRRINFLQLSGSQSLYNNDRTSPVTFCCSFSPSSLSAALTASMSQQSWWWGAGMKKEGWGWRAV